MSGPVDVLAVMDYLSGRYVANRGTEHQFISCITPNCHGSDECLRKSTIGAAWLDLIEARAAVAELIEADAEFDKANAAYNPIFAKGNKAHTYHDFIAAKKRREAALARVQGGARP